MYESQFDLIRRPFGAIPDAQCFLAAEPIQAALDELVVCVEQGQGIAIVSASAGVGKTLLCERLRLELGDRYQTAYLHHATFLTRAALFQSILCELNHPYHRHDEQELRLETVSVIRSIASAKQSVVLLCDEAHLLAEDLLEELRILSDLSEHGRSLVRLVLVGQHPLEETLVRPGLDALNQRIRAHICLDAFNRETSLDYVDFRLTWGGGRTEEIFTPEALELICRASEGVPRCINQLCDHALLLAYVSEQKPVTAETIRDALQDLRQLPLHWNESLVADVPTDTPVVSAEQSTGSSESPFFAGSSDEMLSLEVGADLPSSSVQMSLSTMESPESGEPAGIVEPLSADEPLITGESSIQTCDNRSPDHIEDLRPDCLDQAPCKSSMLDLTPAGRRTVSRPIHRSMSDLEEEIVWDRYAAIDGGFELPSPASIETTTDTTTDSTAPDVWPEDTSTIEQVHGEPPAVGMISDGSSGSTANSPVAPDSFEPPLASLGEADGFEAVCARLDHWLPEYHENPGWDPLVLESEFAPDVVFGSTTDRQAQSVEVDLAMTVCEMVDELRGEARSSSTLIHHQERLDEVLRAAATEEIHATGPIEIPESIETAPVLEIEQQSGAAITAEANSPPVRPFRNLFTMLRRKQQGLF